jgi:SnoaL-like protein
LFARWLRRYGEVWESRYPEGVRDLYSPDVLYYWTPFDEPKRGEEEIVEASREASSRQDNISFSSELIAVNGNLGWARWQCSFRRVATGREVRLDGILQATFDEQGRCNEFREWWHSDEPISERP